MSGLEACAAQIGARAVARLRGRAVAALNAELGDAAREDADGVVIEGRRAVQRMLAEPGLRWIAGLLK